MKKKEYSNNKWNEFTFAVNQTILTQNDKVIADVIFYNFDYNDKNKSENIEKNSSSKVIYFEDQYVIKNEQGKTKYVLQPFKIGDENLKGTSEVNTVINENAVMKRNGDNTRPWNYQEDLERYKKEFDSLEELKNFLIIEENNNEKISYIIDIPCKNIIIICRI